jgi:hypothetical protein
MSRYYRKSPMKYILPPEISTGLDAGMSSVEALNPELYQSSSTTSTTESQYTAQATQKKTIFDYLPWILVGILMILLLMRK